MQLPVPPRIDQGSQLRCWAAAIASLLEATGSPCRTIEWIVEHARRNTTAHVDCNGALRTKPPNYSELIDVVGLFGLNFQRYFSEADAAARPGAKVFGLGEMKARIEQKKYAMMIYKDPAWTYDGAGAWHCVVVYGVDEDNQRMLVMDPDGGRLAAAFLAPEITYFIADRAINSPWSP